MRRPRRIPHGPMLRHPKSAFLAAILALAALSAGAPAAQAQVSWVIRGHGFGHGVGMSQYGAYGYAKHGKGYRFILGHYFKGTSIGTLREAHVVRVLVGVVGDDIGFSGATSACGEGLSPTREYRAHRSDSSTRAATRWPTAGASCAPPAAAGSRSAASAPTAVPSRSSRPIRTRAP